MVTEEQVRKVPVTTMRMAYEEKIEQTPVRVCKQVAELSTVKVPRCVEKRVPVTYTYRVPRTITYRVPVVACGNEISVAPAATVPSATTLTPSTVPAESSAPHAGPATSQPTLARVRRPLRLRRLNNGSTACPAR